MTRMLREARGWTQEHLAVVSGVHVRTIQRVEAGGSASAETLGALAAAFNVAATDVGGPVHVVPVREWEQDVLFPDDGAVYRSWETSERQVCAPMPVGPVKVKRFRFEFPVGEQPCLIVERKVGRMVVSEDGPREVWKPRRVMFPTFTEARRRTSKRGRRSRVGCGVWWRRSTTRGSTMRRRGRRGSGR